MIRLIALFYIVLVACDAHAQQRPNVVLIISDDQTYRDFGFMGNVEVHTPNLDTLARQSARYVNGYVPSSVCRPSLVSILTGLYPHQHKVHFNHPPPGFAKLTKSVNIDKTQFDALREKPTKFVRNVPTLPRELAKAGYRCFQTGKYWEGHFRNAGFTEGMTTAQPSTQDGITPAKYGDKQLPSGDIVAHGNGDHGLSIGRETMQPIQRFMDDCGEQPFFLWYAPFLPHAPHDSPQEYYDLLADRDIAKHKLPYYASIAQFDRTVGDLMSMLAERQLMKNTIVVFVVDNGWTPDVNRFVKQRREWDHTPESKRAPFEDGLRTPILIRWDRHVQPARHTELVSSIDIMPSCLAACGIKLPDGLLGQNLMPSATGESKLDSGRAVFGGIYPGDASKLGAPSQDIAYRWVRQHDLKLIVPHKQRGKAAWKGLVTAPALFNVRKDPREQNDLARQSASDAKRLQKLLDQWWLPDPK